MKPAKERANAGFTLAEVLVAICLLALISSYSLAALENLRRMDIMIERFETKLAIESVVNYLHQSLSGARPLAISIDHVHTSIAFTGEETRVEFVAPGNAALEASGLLIVTVEAAARDDGLINLVTTRQPLGEVPSQARGEVWPLYEGLKQVKFRYFGQIAPDNSDRWHAGWVKQSTLPKLIEIMIEGPEGAGRDWPRLVVHPASAL
jgi:general secretion pathway protein J